MTANELKAIELATGLAERSVDPATLSDDDWFLLLLAAGVNSAASTLAVARRVLEAAERRVGYFAPTESRRGGWRGTMVAA